ncbi:5-hydroxytryptamine receptor 1A-alpha-like [Strongylocentrotus purpuratus]|uniref:G-protein coupled receptors family 1 profile domain-containing protein n=1 Tax=Strongylocentrotus purpuratus TaxID=7668 RepID=A0A7M7NWD5_STRPU|nr:5-hydroxytryptamine receptor 1A-alpha-like [Strongylocentrotus purpuratus]
MAELSTISIFTSTPPSGSSSNYYLYKDLDLPQRVILAIMLLITSFTGIIGNSIVILAIVLSRKLRSTLNWFVLNLACADLLTSLYLPFHVVDLLGRMGWVQLNWFQLGWPYVAWFYVNKTCVGVSLTTHALIGFTSWYRITRNQEKFKKLYQARNLCLMIAFTWVFNFSSLCLIARLDEEKIVFAIAFWVFGHFAIVVTVYLKLWRFIAHQAEKIKPTKKVDGKIQNEMCMDTICPNGNKDIQQGGLVIENTVLRASHSSEHLESQDCDISKGERLKSGQPETHMHDAETLTVSSSLEEIESTVGGSDLKAKVPRRVEGSETKLHVKKQSEPKIDKKLLAVTKILLVILVAFVICFIPYAVSLCLPKSYSALPWLLALLLSNSCINPIIYARRIRAFREVMICIIRCRLGSIPMPIDLVRKMRTTR